MYWQQTRFREQFEEGIMAMGSLALSMVGIITLAPVLANLLSPIVVPVYELLGLIQQCLPQPYWLMIWAALR